MSVKRIQQALASLGFDPGPIDGIMGRRTTSAIKAFQTQQGLTADGLVGPNTREKLFAGDQPTAPTESSFEIPTSIPWLSAAFSLMGTREVPGKGSNEAIMGWAEDLELHSYNDDDIPWCGLFVAHCVSSQLADEVLPANPLGARKWQSFGVETQPRLGAVLVFWRGSKNGWKGHVGFYWAEDDEAYHVLGGNQSNEVSVTRIAKQRLLSARWPKSGLQTDFATRIAAVNGQLLSQNEA